MNLEKSIEMSQLFDFYGKLLTTKQYDIFYDYYYLNISLSEIAENRNISRQAVRDSLVKSENQLKRFDESLDLIKKYYTQKSIVEKLQQNSKLIELTEILRVWEK